jgi:hypothetical protein
MPGRLLTSGGALTLVLGVAWSTTAGVKGQTQVPATKVSAKATKAWTPPRTPWGDPDLQGNFTNKSEQGTPFERPTEFEGRQIKDIQEAELTDILRERQERIVNNARPPDGGVHAPLHWSDRFDILKGSRPWLIVDPADGKIPPTTPEARNRLAARAAAQGARGRGPADSYEDRSLYDRCITRGLPGSMMPAIYGDSYQIVQGPGYVAIRYEMVHETRIIPLDHRPHAGTAIRQYMGDGRGHWEGDTLVVETTNFKDGSTCRNANADSLRLVERFTRTARDKVEWAATIDDSTTWVRPWTFSLPLTIDDHEPIFEYACHEGNYGLRNILSGARTEERIAAEDGKKGIVRPPSRPAAGGDEGER